MQFVSRSLRILWVVVGTCLLFGAGRSAAQGPDVKLEISGLYGPYDEEGTYAGEATVSVSNRPGKGEGGTTVYVWYRLADGTWPTPVTFYDLRQDLDERRQKLEQWKEQCPSQDCPNEPLIAPPPPNRCHPVEFNDQLELEEACRGLSSERLKVGYFLFTPPPGTEEIRFHAEYDWYVEEFASCQVV